MAKPSSCLPSVALCLGALAATPMGCGLSDRYYVDHSLVGGNPSDGGLTNTGGTSLGGQEPLAGTESSNGGTSSSAGSGNRSGDTGGEPPSGGTPGAKPSGGTSAGGELGSSGESTARGGAFEEGGSGPDLAGAGGAASAECELGPFGEPEPLLELSVGEDQWGPALAADGHTLYFTVWDGDSTHIYTARRAERGGSFSEVKPLPGLRPSDALPAPSSDGLTLYFVSSRLGGTDKNIWFATRANEEAPFSNILEVPRINSNRNDQRPWISADQLTLMFVSDRGGGAGTLDIWWSKRDSASASFSNPANLREINSPAQEESPALSADGLTLYFSSSREDSKDLYTATRPDLESGFGKPRLLVELNSEEDEVDIALSADDRELFFASNRDGPSQIWRATRECVEPR